jgi:uncharacterized membrane protein HdeD (DUF308 family)
VFKAGRWVDDMVGLNEVIRPVLIRHVLDAAAGQYLLLKPRRCMGSANAVALTREADSLIFGLPHASPMGGNEMADQFDTRTWSGLALRGLIAIVFGILALARPGSGVIGLAYLFGAYAFLDGVLAIAAAANVAQMRGPWWPIMLAGFCGVAVAVLSFSRPAATAVGLTYYIAAWAVFTGILEVVAAFRLRRIVQREWMLAVAGLLSVAFGIMIAARPDAGLLSLIWTVGVFAIIFGGLVMGLAFRLRGDAQRLVPS